LTSLFKRQEIALKRLDKDFMMFSSISFRPYECNEKKIVFRSEKGGKPGHFHSHFQWKAVRDAGPTVTFLRQTSIKDILIKGLELGY
jgi:hypothetical protein